MINKNTHSMIRLRKRQPNLPLDLGQGRCLRVGALGVSQQSTRLVHAERLLLPFPVTNKAMLIGGDPFLWTNDFETLIAQYSEVYKVGNPSFRHKSTNATVFINLPKNYGVLAVVTGGGVGGGSVVGLGVG
jgi:hypothetical protein